MVSEVQKFYLILDACKDFVPIGTSGLGSSLKPGHQISFFLKLFQKFLKKTIMIRYIDGSRAVIG